MKCCYPRPTVERYEPVSDPDPVCRNSQVSVTFDQEMDVNTITEDQLRSSTIRMSNPVMMW